jgi:hypothetical protein
MSREDFNEGDRVVYVGDDFGPKAGMPLPGERGTISFMHPMDDIIVLDKAGDVTGSIGDDVRHLTPDEIREEAQYR